VLGVYIPTIAPTLAVVGGSGTTESRAYVYSFVTQYGEEGALSPPVVVSGFQNGSWNLSAMEAVPPNSGTVSGAVVVSSGIVEVTLNTARGLALYEEVTFSGVVGMTDLNGTFALTSVDLATNKVRVALNTAQTYTSGGAWERRAPHNITSMKRRIYRTVGTNTDYKLVTEQAASSTVFNDTVASTALGSSPAVSLGTFTPPKNGHSLVSLANGALAMLAGNELCISEQYKPYSWPLANRYAFAGQGVALVAGGNSLIVLTDAVPVVATATVPEATSLAYLEDAPAPCISKTGVVDAGSGALYPSNDGLWLATPSGGRNVTANLYRQKEWEALHPSTFKATFRDGTYYAARAGDSGNAGRLWMLDLAEADSVVEVDDTFDALHKSPYDGNLYVAQGKAIYQFDGDDANRYVSFWQSAQFQLGAPVNLSVAQVHARYSDIVPLDTSVQTANLALLASANNIEGAIGTSPVGVLPIGASNLQEAPVQTANRVQFTLLRAGQVVFTRELSASKPFKLPAGVKDDVYAVQIAASIPVYSITVADSVAELARSSQ
jgi:hypothetical protein